MTPSFIQRLTDLENVLFFIAGVLFAGVVSGICTFWRWRNSTKDIVVSLKP